MLNRLVQTVVPMTKTVTAKRRLERNWVTSAALEIFRHHLVAIAALVFIVPQGLLNGAYLNVSHSTRP